MVQRSHAGLIVMLLASLVVGFVMGFFFLKSSGQPLMALLCWLVASITMLFAGRELWPYRAQSQEAPVWLQLLAPTSLLAWQLPVNLERIRSLLGSNSFVPLSWSLLGVVAQWGAWYAMTNWLNRRMTTHV
ncbi:hypothetical protein [Deinococcus xinjiangensis]|uniref:hypothetical protein n=1 Tax=Deinococcus xinjiangensis TaxID=457454 RepID=UPI00336579D1